MRTRLGACLFALILIAGTGVVGGTIAASERTAAVTDIFLPAVVNEAVLLATPPTPTTIPPPGAIAGIVRDDASFLPLQGAQVAANGPTGTRSAFTDADGKYAITSLLPGVYSVTASTFGYAPSVVDVVVGSTTVTLDLFLIGSTPTATASPTATATATATPIPGAMSGVVRDIGSGVLLAAATVVADGPSGTVGTLTNGSGQYTLVGLWPGSYQVTASESGYVPQVLQVLVASSVTSTANFTLTALTPTPTATETPTSTSTATAINTTTYTATTTATETPSATETVSITLTATACATSPSWAERASMPTVRWDLAASLGPTGLIYAIGGYNNASGPTLNANETYNPATNTWAEEAPMPTARLDLGVAPGGDGQIYAIGGESGSTPYTVYSTVEVYNPVANTWSAAPSALTPMSGFGVTEGLDGNIYIFGGRGTGRVAVNTAYLYRPMLGTWTAIANMPVIQDTTVAVTAGDGTMYVIGGDNSFDGGAVTTVQRYDPSSNTWSSRAPLPVAELGAAVGLGSDGRIYVIGGANTALLNAVQIYDPTTDTWTFGPNLPTTRGNMAGAAAGSGVYALAGTTTYLPGTASGVNEELVVSTTCGMSSATSTATSTAAPPG